MIEKVLPNDVFKRFNKNKTQVLHRILLLQYNSDRPLDDESKRKFTTWRKSSNTTRRLVAWETEFEPFFDNPIRYQDPIVIGSRGIIENIFPANAGNQKTDDCQNLNIDPVIDHPTPQDVSHSTVMKQNFDSTPENHVQGNQVLVNFTEITSTEYTNDMPYTSKTNDLHNDNNTPGGNYNLRPNCNPNCSDIYRYWKHPDYKISHEINVAVSN